MKCCLVEFSETTKMFSTYASNSQFILRAIFRTRCLKIYCPSSSCYNSSFSVPFPISFGPKLFLRVQKMIYGNVHAHGPKSEIQGYSRCHGWASRVHELLEDVCKGHSHVNVHFSEKWSKVFTFPKGIWNPKILESQMIKLNYQKRRWKKIIQEHLKSNFPFLAVPRILLSHRRW